MMKDTRIIDLSKTDYSDATICDEINLIHKSKMQEILDVWHKLYSQCDSRSVLLENDTDEVHSVHNTISIFGSRGAGKTTFLLSFLKRIKDEDKKSELLLLNRIDPTHIENKQHTFINVLASIQNATNELDNSRNKGCVNRKYSEGRLQLNEYYTRILKALPFIDGIGKEKVYDEWEDEEYISLNGMERANASNNMERNFHLYIQTALKYLDKKCVVIPFDDIDTDFQKGFEVLEVIRKFLTTPQIITVITGDLELYSKLVRRSKWIFFDKEFLNKEINYGKHSKEEFSEMIDQLENQYLMKILKPENRILLGTIKEYMEDPNFEIEVKINEEMDLLPIKTSYYGLIKNLGFNVNDDSLLERLISFLMNLSFRAQIQLLTLLKEMYDGKRDVASGLLKIFWNDINQTANNPKELLGKNEKYSVNMLQYLVDTRKLYTNSNFLPESDNKIINKALLAIGSRFNQLLKKHSHLVFDYWLRISYIQYTTDALGSANKDELLKDFLNFIQFNSETSLHKMVGLGQAYCNCELNMPSREKREKETLPGIIYLGDESPAIYSTYAILANIPMMGTLDVSKHESVFLSVYRLLAVIKEILANYVKVEVDNIDNFNILISKYSQYRNFKEPNKYPTENLKNNPLYDWGVYEFIENNELIHNLHDEFVKWRSLKVKVSTLLLNRIFTRFYYTMINVDGDKSYSNAAEKLHAYIIALWNAALVECELENDVFTFVNLNNNKDIEGIFIDNYRDYFLLKNKIDENTDSVTIFEWLLRCPILKLYINPLLLYFIEDSTYWTKETYLKGLLKYDRIESSRKTIQVKIESLMKQYNRYDQIQSWIDKYWELKEVERRIRMYERDLSESIKKNNGIEKRRELDSIINELKRKEEVLRTRLGDFVDLDLQIDLTVDNSESSVKDIELNIRNTMRNLMDKRREYINKLNLLKPLDKNIAKFVKNDYNKVKAGRESYANKTTYDYLSQYVI